MSDDIRAPKMTRLKRSRPWLSVPRGWARLGGWSVDRTLIRSGSYGMRDGANTPTSRNNSEMAPPAIPMRRRRAKVRRGVRPRAANATCGCPLTVSYLGVEDAIQQIHQQVYQDKGRGEQQKDVLNQRNVTLPDG